MPASLHYTAFTIRQQHQCPRKMGGCGTFRNFSSCASPLILQLPLSSSTPPPSLVLTARLTPSDAPQRSEEWFALRRDKLTTSTFSTALGFWKGNCRSDLWHEKVFASDAQSVEASKKGSMEWGVLNEAAAIERYKSITGCDVSSLGFATHSEERFYWLGASPDGLLPEGGILEVKCPYKKGSLRWVCLGQLCHSITCLRCRVNGDNG